MSDIVLRDIDPALQRRIERVARRCAWSLPETLAQLLEAGLAIHDAAWAAPALDEGENEALVRAIAALEGLPDDPGFARIGRDAAAGLLPA